MIDTNKLFRSFPIHGIPVNISNMEQALVEVETLISLQKQHYVCFFEGNLLACALQKKDVYNVISKATLIYPDGIAVAKELQWNIGKKVSRVSGPSFLLNACQYGIKRNWRHYFLGGGDGVAQNLVNALKENYPGIQIAGCYTPPFRELTLEEDLYIKKEIEKKHVDLLWVGLGGPKQEFWMYNHLEKIKVPVMLGIGAAFDFHSGGRPWASPFIRKIGAEWLFRLLTGGKKIFVRNTKCICFLFSVLLLDWIKHFFRTKKNIKESWLVQKQLSKHTRTEHDSV